VARLDAVKGAAVNIKLRDGQCPEARVETPLGHHTRPVPVEKLREKFRDCCRHTLKPLAPNRVHELISLIESLDQLNDMRKLPILATGGDLLSVS
jgi:2-methylcitrate dehydratase PrpD